MSVRRNIAANYLGQGLAAAISLLLVPLYVEWLGIESYALVGLLAVVQAWAQLLDLGLPQTVTREMARFKAGTASLTHARDLLVSMEWIYAGIGLLVIVGLTAAAPWAAQHWLQVESLALTTVVTALSLLAVVVALRLGEGLLRNALMGLQLQVWANVVGSGMALLRSVGALAVLAWVSPTILAFFVWQALISVLTVLLFWLKLHGHLPRGSRRGRFSRAALGEVRQFAGGVFAASLLGVILTQADKLLLSRLLPLSDFGYYMLASTLAASLYLACWPVLTGLVPTLVERIEVGDAPGVVRRYHKAAQLITVLMAPVALLLAVLPDAVLMAWWGDAARAAATAPILTLLAMGTFIHASLQLPIQTQLTHGWTRLSLFVNMAAVSVCVPALLILVPRHGPVAGAAIWLAVNVGAMLVMVHLMHRRLLPGEAGTWYRRDLGGPVLAALVVLVPARLLLDHAALSRPLLALVLAVLGALALAAAALAAPDVRAAALARLRRPVMAAP